MPTLLPRQTRTSSCSCRSQILASKSILTTSSFDVSSLGCTTTGHADNLVDIITTYADSSAQARYQNKVLVSTFAGEYCNFGQGSTNAGWTYVKKLLSDQKVSIYLMPAIFSDPSGFKDLTWMDGEFNWNSAWPMTAAPIDTASDERYMSALGTKGYMPAMSPGFFTVCRICLDDVTGLITVLRCQQLQQELDLPR